MCFSSSAPSIPPPAPPPPPPAPAPQLPDKNVQVAGDDARKRAAAANGAMSTIINIGGAGGLNTPADTTANSGGKKQLGS